MISGSGKILEHLSAVQVSGDGVTSSVLLLLFFFMWTIFSLYGICYSIVSVFCFGFGHKACGILAPQPGTEPSPPAFEGGVLTTGLPGYSQLHSLMQI